MKGRLRFALLVIIPALGISVVRAAGVPYVGPYAGSDVLLARLDPKRAPVRDTQVRNDRDLGWKGLVGVRMSPHFAFEASYTDFDKATSPPVVADLPMQARTRAFTAFGVGIMPVGPVEIFAKAGPARMQSTGHAGRSYFDYQERKIAYGAGVQLVKRRLVVRAEYEQFSTRIVRNLNAISLGVRLTLRPD